MENYDDMYKSICRVCLSQSNAEKMVSLIDNSTEDGLSSFGKAINIVTNVLLLKDDQLPFMMCLKCVYLLKQTIYFKLKCESTDKKLKALLNSGACKGLSEDNIKENVCDYVMYIKYIHLSSVSKGTVNNHYPKKLPQQHSNDKYVNSSAKIEVDDNNRSDNDREEFNETLDNHDATMEKSDEYSNETNNILDSIQCIINSEKEIKTDERQKTEYRKRKNRPKACRNKRNLVCNICNKVLANGLTYDHHMQRHNLCTYICDQCGKGFPVLAEMHMHQIARHGIGPYLQCAHCPYKAPRKLTLIEHLRIHTGERPFTCEKCGLTFRRQAIWRNHLVRHMDKKFQCTYCPKKFFTRSYMLTHCNNIHERMYMYMCSVCNVMYATNKTVRKHMLVKHGIPREKQGKVIRVNNSNNGFPDKVN